MTSNMDTSEIVKTVLQEAADKYKNIQVNKHIPLDFDLGTLLASDPDEIDLKIFKKNQEDFLKNLARDNTQLLINKIWELPSSKCEEAIVVKLPEPNYRLPRELPVPKEKQLTKWERFAKVKGIQKTKKSKLVWDDILSKWVPRYGYQRKAAEKERDWCLEVPGNADPKEDQFAKRLAIRSEKVAKNEYQRLRNIAASKKVKIPRAIAAPGSSEVRASIALAKVSTASAGKFQPELKNEKRRRNALPKKSLQPMMPRPAKKPKKIFTSIEEKKNNAELLDDILKKRPKLNMEKAINRQMYQEDNQAHEERKTKKSGRKGKKKGGGKKSISKRNGSGKKQKNQLASGNQGKKKSIGRKKK